MASFLHKRVIGVSTLRHSFACSNRRTVSFKAVSEDVPLHVSAPVGFLSGAMGSLTIIMVPYGNVLSSQGAVWGWRWRAHHPNPEADDKTITGLLYIDSFT